MTLFLIIKAPEWADVELNHKIPRDSWKSSLKSYLNTLQFLSVLEQYAKNQNGI